jgi:hypothetical protein
MEETSRQEDMIGWLAKRFDKWFVKSFNDWCDKQLRIQNEEDAKWDHMFKRLWESRNERIPK